MYSLKKSLVALTCLLIVVALATLLPLVGRGQTDSKNPLRRDPRKSYYLTQTTHTGGQALSACAEGYHMASLWEILDPSNLRYDNELGYTTADSGSGPPVEYGFARTGREALGGAASARSIVTHGRAIPHSGRSSPSPMMFLTPTRRRSAPGKLSRLLAPTGIVSGACRIDGEGRRRSTPESGRRPRHFRRGAGAASTDRAGLSSRRRTRHQKCGWIVRHLSYRTRIG